MKIDDETVQAYAAGRDLYHLYGAYQATARAQIAVTRQLRRAVERRAEGESSQPTLRLAEIERNEALFRHTDAVFQDRRQQVRGRLVELLGMPGLR